MLKNYKNYKNYESKIIKIEVQIFENFKLLPLHLLIDKIIRKIS